MHRGLKVASGMAVILIILTAVQVVTSALPEGRSPYLSALSNIEVQSALAAPGCNNKTCEKDPRKGPTCFKAAGSNCSVSGGCTSTPCP